MLVNVIDEFAVRLQQQQSRQNCLKVDEGEEKEEEEARESGRVKGGGCSGGSGLTKQR